jgi:hypothetical protein
VENYKKPFYHFSIDDVIDSLIEVSNSSDNLFSQPLFNFLYILNQKYDAHIDLYCFYEKNITDKTITLNDISDNHKEIFSKNPWLRFGPHALNTETAPYSQTTQQQIQVFDLIYKEIERFTGISSKCNLIRLHFFTESYELSDYFHSKNVHSLFTTDKPAISHRMNNTVKSKLKNFGYATFNEMGFVRSHFRIETIVEKNLSNKEIEDLLQHYLSTFGFVTFLTHEYELTRSEIRSTIDFILNYLHKHNVNSI